MAGHPTIGIDVRAGGRRGRSQRDGTDFVFELGVGPTPVSLDWKDGRARLRVDDAAAAVLRPDAPTRPDSPPRSGSTRRTRPRRFRRRSISVRRAVPLRAARLARRRSIACRSIGAPSPPPAGEPGFDELPVFLSRPTARAQPGTRRCTAACSRRVSASREDPATGERQRSARLLPGHHGVLDAGAGAIVREPAGRRHAAARAGCSSRSIRRTGRSRACASAARAGRCVGVGGLIPASVSLVALNFQLAGLLLDEQHLAVGRQRPHVVRDDALEAVARSRAGRSIAGTTLSRKYFACFSGIAVALVLEQRLELVHARP